MKKFGLIGYPLSHSFSKKYFGEKFEKENLDNCTYELFPIEKIEQLSKLLQEHPDLCGLNVTIPHKINVMHQLDWIADDAKQVGAVNCISISSESPVMAALTGEVGIKRYDFRLEGYNTDVYGFEMSLRPLLKSTHQKAMILGNGGAAKAVKYVLDRLGITYIIVTRKPDPDTLLFNELTAIHFNEHKLIINTTPVGTYPNFDECPPIPYEFITSAHILFDLIYNPEQTLFLSKGLEKGATIKNGYEMLVLQAEKAWEIWTSKDKQ